MEGERDVWIQTWKYTHLPYMDVAGVSEHLRRVCSKYLTRTVFTIITNHRKQLTRIKDVDLFMKRAGIVYKILHCCRQVYIGETKTALKTCPKEHQAATRKVEMEKLPIAQYAWENSWDETAILDE